MQWVIGAVIYLALVGGFCALAFRAGQKGWPFKMTESTQYTTHTCETCGDVHLPSDEEARVG